MRIFNFSVKTCVVSEHNIKSRTSLRTSDIYPKLRVEIEWQFSASSTSPSNTEVKINKTTRRKLSRFCRRFIYNIRKRKITVFFIFILLPPVYFVIVIQYCTDNCVKNSCALYRDCTKCIVIYDILEYSIVHCVICVYRVASFEGIAGYSLSN